MRLLSSTQTPAGQAGRHGSGCCDKIVTSSFLLIALFVAPVVVVTNLFGPTTASSLPVSLLLLCKGANRGTDSATAMEKDESAPPSRVAGGLRGLPESSSWSRLFAGSPRRAQKRAGILDYLWHPTSIGMGGSGRSRRTSLVDNERPMCWRISGTSNLDRGGGVPNSTTQISGSSQGVIDEAELSDLLSGGNNSTKDGPVLLTGDEIASKYHIDDLLNLYPLETHGIHRLDECWDGFDIQVTPPSEDFLQVNKYHDFQIKVKVRQPGNSAVASIQNETDGDTMTGDDKAFRGMLVPLGHVHIRLILCDVRRSGFCTPYSVADEAELEQAHNEKNDNPGFDDFHSVRSDPHESRADHLASLVKYKIPAPDRHEDVEHSATAYHTTELSPPLSMLVHQRENVARVVDTNTGEVVGGTLNNGKGEGDAYVEQEKTFTIRLNAEGHVDGHPRTFLVVAHVVMFASRFDDPTHISERMDMANAMPENLITYQDPELVTASTAFVVTMAAVLGGVVVVELFMLGSILRNRKHDVMRLSQYPLLSLMVAAAAVATASSFLLIPLNDTFCHFHEALIFVPGTLVGAVLLGRIWRINVILAPAKILALRGEKKRNPVECVMMESLRVLSEFDPFSCNPANCLRVPRSCVGSGRGVNPCSTKRTAKRNRSELKRSVSLNRVLWLISLLMIPQIALQVCVLAVPSLTMRRVVELNDHLTQGRYMCHSGGGDWPLYLGWALMIIPYVLALPLARFSRHLPSLFNECRRLMHAASVNIIILVIGIPLFVLTNNPNVSPNVTAFLEITIVVGMVFTSCWFSVVGKLKIVWSGKKVVVSKLLRTGGMSSGSERHSGVEVDYDSNTLFTASESHSRHRNSVIGVRTSASSDRRTSCISARRSSVELPSPGVDVPGSSFEPRDILCRDMHEQGVLKEDSSAIQCDVLPGDTLLADATMQNDERHRKQRRVSFCADEAKAADFLEDIGNGEAKSIHEDLHGKQPAESSTPPPKIHKGDSYNSNHDRKQDPIVVHIDKPLPTRLEMQIFCMTEVLEGIREKVMTGVQIPKNELEDLATKSKRFGRVCENIVISEAA